MISMLDLAQHLEGLSAADAREVAYFLSRYFKGAPFLEPKGKDIFSDVFDYEPDDNVRRITLKVIAQIEAEVGCPASEFDDETAYRVLDKITDFELGLDKPLSADQIADASGFFRSVSNPPASKTED